MKRRVSLLILAYMMIGCQDDKGATAVDYRQEMRDFVQSISQYAAGIHPGFIIIPQNGVDLLTSDGEEEGSLQQEYLAAINGIGQESLLYGYDIDDQPTPPDVREWTRGFQELARDCANLVILVTDYCYTPTRMTDSYTCNSNQGYISSAADHRELDKIPFFPTSPWNENDAPVTSLEAAANFLYLINPQQFDSRQELVEAIAATNYDLVIMDYFFNSEEFSVE